MNLPPLTAALLLAAASLATAQAPQDRKSAYEALSKKALEPERLQREAKESDGCRITDVGHRGDDKRLQFYVPGAGKSSLPGAPVVEAQNVRPELRKPRYYEPAERPNATDFALDGDDRSHVSVGELRGTPVVVFVFRPECKWTEDVMGEVLKLQSLEAKAGIRVLPVMVSESGMTRLTAFRQKNFAVLTKDVKLYIPSSEPGKGLSVFPDLEVTPTTYILDRQGRLAWRISGGIRGAIQDKLNMIRLEP